VNPSLDRAIDYLQVAILDLESLQKPENLGRFETYGLVDKISKRLVDCADLIREGGSEDTFAASHFLISKIRNAEFDDLR
jgi:hypothetical protein